MPQLLFLSQFQPTGDLNPNFYFKKVSSLNYGKTFKFDIKLTYPYETYMHEDTSNKEITCEILLDLRRFAERRASGDIILSHVDLSHVWCWNASRAKGNWDRDYSDIRHHYIVLNFEYKEDMITWKLMYPEYVTDEMSKFHPEYIEHHADCKEHRWS